MPAFVRDAESHSRELISAVEQGLEAHSAAVVLVTPDGRVEDASNFARQLLEAYFGRGAGLPAQLGDWTASDPGSEPLTVMGPRGCLLIRRLPALAGRAGAVLLLSESRPHPPSIAALVELGLSLREAEVLRLVAIGIDNADIASQLGIAVATVRKHLEGIYSSLGVHSRTEAAARAMGMFGGTAVVPIALE